MNWFDGLSAFERVAEHHGFARAAQEMQLPTSVITKRIQWLEQKLGITLFARTTRLVTLTENGEYLLKRIKPLLEEWQEVQRQLLDYQAEPQGNLSICFPPNISRLSLFVDIFQQFIQSHPKIKLNFMTTTKPVSLQNEKIDFLIAIEKYVLDPQETVGVKLLSFTYQCFASPTYLAKHGVPQKPSDLAAHNCVIFKNDHDWEFSRKLIRVTGNWHTDAGDSLIAACLAGIGIVYMPGFMVQKELQEGQLEHVLMNYASKREQLSLYYLKQQYKPRKIVLLIDFLRKHFDNV